MLKKDKWKTKFFMVALGQAVSLLGSHGVQFAMIWWLAEQTSSPLMLGLSGLVAYLPMGLCPLSVPVYTPCLDGLYPALCPGDWQHVSAAGHSIDHPTAGAVRDTCQIKWLDADDERRVFSIGTRHRCRSLCRISDVCCSDE